MIQNAKFCFVCAKPLTWTDSMPACPEHGTLWGLVRNAPCAEAFIVKDSKVLLIRRNHEPRKGFWAIPGGFSDYGEHPQQTAAREAREETGWEVEITGILGAYIDSFPGDTNSEHRLVVSYLAKPISKHTAHEGMDSGWFSPSNLPAEFIAEQLGRFHDYKSRL